MDSFSVAAGEGAHRVEVVCVLPGDDVCLCIGGGARPHVGAAALAVPRESLRGGEASASASVLCVTGHKEDELVRETALRFAARLGVNVLVSAGLHIDQADERDIGLLLANCRSALDLALVRLTGG